MHEDAAGGFGEDEIRQVAFGAVYLPFALEERHGAAAHVHAWSAHVFAAEGDEVDGRAVGARDPAGELDGHRLEADVGVVFRLQSRFDDFELELTDGAEDGIAFAPLRWPIKLNGAFLRELLEALFELLSAERIDHHHAR